MIELRLIRNTATPSRIAVKVGNDAGSIDIAGGINAEMMKNQKLDPGIAFYLPHGAWSTEGLADVIPARKAAVEAFAARLKERSPA